MGAACLFARAAYMATADWLPHELLYGCFAGPYEGRSVGTDEVGQQPLPGTAIPEKSRGISCRRTTVDGAGV